MLVSMRVIRAGWMIVSIALIAYSLSRYAELLQPYLRIRYGIWFETGMAVGQILFQSFFIWRTPLATKMDYAVILVGVSLFGSALLWPVLLVGASPSFAGLYFMGVAGVMFVVHWGLVHRRGLPTRLCFTWMIYRLLILVFVVRF